MIRIRLEGIISACTRRHPLKSAAKIRISEQNTKKNVFFFVFSSVSTFERSSKIVQIERSSKVRISEQTRKKVQITCRYRQKSVSLQQESAPKLADRQKVWSIYQLFSLQRNTVSLSAQPATIVLRERLKVPS